MYTYEGYIGARVISTCVLGLIIKYQVNAKPAYIPLSSNACIICVCMQYIPTVSTCNQSFLPGHPIQWESQILEFLVDRYYCLEDSREIRKIITEVKGIFFPLSHLG